MLAECKLMPEMHLRQPAVLCKPAFTYKSCATFTKSKKRIQKFNETGDSRYFYQSELNKACFKYDIGYCNFKNLRRRTASGKVLRDKAFDIAKSLKYDRYQRGLASMVYIFFDKKSAATHVHSENLAIRDKSATTHRRAGINSNLVSENQQLAAHLVDKLHKLNIRKF